MPTIIETTITALDTNSLRKILALLNTDSKISADIALQLSCQAMNAKVLEARQAERDRVAGKIRSRISARREETRQLLENIRFQRPDDLEARALLTMVELTHKTGPRERDFFRYAMNSTNRRPILTFFIFILLPTATVAFRFIPLVEESPLISTVLMATIIISGIVTEDFFGAEGGFGFYGTPVFELHEDEDNIHKYNLAKAALRTKHPGPFQNNQKTIQDIHDTASLIATSEQAKALLAVEEIKAQMETMSRYPESIQSQSSFFAIDSVLKCTVETDGELEKCMEKIRNVKIG